jgi:hypothetical protein
MAAKAVLVGVAEYERPEIPPLRGCVNDVLAVRGVLKDVIGLTNDDIRVVVNARATKANILYRLAEMVEGSVEGDCLVFYFSGHGSQVRDRDGDELTDQLDEVLCPYDMDWDEKTFILDDELDAIFAELPEGVLLEAFFDCCFWGARARDVFNLAGEEIRPDVRFLPPPVDIAARAEGDDEWLPVHHWRGCSCFQDRNVLWAASEEGQAAVEDFFEGGFNGVFTYFGCRFLAENGERIWQQAYTRQSLLDDLQAFLASYGYLQVPGLEARQAMRQAGPFTLGAAFEERSSRRYRY